MSNTIYFKNILSCNIIFNIYYLYFGWLFIIFIFLIKIDKFGGYSRRLIFEWSQWKHRNNWPEKFAASRREKKVRAWLQGLVTDPPEVLLGANFAPVGGVRHHLQAIQKYSALKIELAPSDLLLEHVGMYHLRHDFTDLFSNFKPQGISNVHSHVFPWFL